MSDEFEKGLRRVTNMLLADAVKHKKLSIRHCDDILRSELLPLLEKADALVRNNGSGIFADTLRKEIRKWQS